MQGQMVMGPGTRILRELQLPQEFRNQTGKLHPAKSRRIQAQGELQDQVPETFLATTRSQGHPRGPARRLPRRVPRAPGAETQDRFQTASDAQMPPSPASGGAGQPPDRMVTLRSLPFCLLVVYCVVIVRSFVHKPLCKILSRVLGYPTRPGSPARARSYSI